jgi:hypothetical protein
MNFVLSANATVSFSSALGGASVPVPAPGAFALIGTIITGFIPAVASLASLVFAGVVRARYRRGLKAS